MNSHCILPQTPNCSLVSRRRTHLLKHAADAFTRSVVIMRWILAQQLKRPAMCKHKVHKAQGVRAQTSRATGLCKLLPATSDYF